PVRVVLHGQPAVGALDLLAVGGLGDPQNFVVISFHSCHWNPTQGRRGGLFSTAPEGRQTVAHIVRCGNVARRAARPTFSAATSPGGAKEILSALRGWSTSVTRVALGTVHPRLTPWATAAPPGLNAKTRRLSSCLRALPD